MHHPASLKTIVIMPAYNAAKTVEKTIRDIPLESINEIILVDDCSTDNTVTVANTYFFQNPQFTTSTKEYTENPTLILCTVISHTTNTGYGGNQKTCYDTALAHGADIVIMIHPDYQYDPTVIPILKEFIINRKFDVMLGSRIRNRKEALASGMPWWKYSANRCLSTTENIVTGRALTDWHTGMRAYTKEVLTSIPYHHFSDDFIFDTQMLLSIIKNKNLIGEIPIPVRYFNEASSINFKRSLEYGVRTLFELVKYF